MHIMSYKYSEQQNTKNTFYFFPYIQQYFTVQSLMFCFLPLKMRYT